MASDARKKSWARYDAKRRETIARKVKEQARKKVQQKQRYGYCMGCGVQGPTVLHHYDYAQPTATTELCHRCHRAEHPRKMPQGGVR